MQKVVEAAPDLVGILGRVELESQAPLGRHDSSPIAYSADHDGSQSGPP